MEAIDTQARTLSGFPVTAAGAQVPKVTNQVQVRPFIDSYDVYRPYPVPMSVNCKLHRAYIVTEALMPTLHSRPCLDTPDRQGD